MNGILPGPGSALGIDRRRGGPSRIAVVALAILMTGFLVASGCNNPNNNEGNIIPENSEVTASTGVPEDVSAKKVTIPPTFCVSPPTLDLSKGNKDRYQFHNTTSIDLLIVFINSAGSEYQPAAELVPAGQFSAVHVVCQSCPEATYEYRVKKLDGMSWVEAICETGAPTVPDISIGP